MQTLPFSIYTNKKGARSKRNLYIILTFACIWAFWYASGHFFTQDYYYPKAVILLPVCIPFIIGGIIGETKNIKNNNPLLTLSEQGIKFFVNPYSEIGLVPWSDITGCKEIKILNSYFLTILAKEHAFYINKITNSRVRKKVLKFSDSNNNALFNIEIAMMDCDITMLRKTIYQMIETTQEKN
ncbi:STM3941 family protein [Flavobacterium sp. FlaQc-48]|uniref:STM3941 family protein n=1 Tax=Flavobacterium sp. FlaQc-48 TaxID=3374181 RepID=UPI0037580788